MSYYDEALGEEVLGDDATVGAGRLSLPGAYRSNVMRAFPRQRGVRLPLPPKPQWREAIAPGVAMPGVGMEPLPLAPDTNGGVFTDTVTAINYEARPQIPFRAERLIVIIGRSSGATAASRILASGIFIGRDLQLVELNNFDLEVFGPQSFGVRLNLVQCTPGMLVRLPCLVGGTAIPALESISVTAMFLGHTVR